MQQISHLIDGKTVAGKSGNSSAVYNPATGEQTGTLDLASVEEVDQAVASSQKAFEDWQTVSVAQRTKLLYNFRNLVEANAEEIASRLTAEHGKVNSDAQGEVARGLENIEFACGVADALKGTYTEHASTGVDVYSVRQPLGVCAGITPFNFPAMVPLWMFPNAVACGNTFVLKPSERDPSAPRFIVELAQEAGFPPGVVNLINGDKVAVDRLLEHSDVKAISFVGSTPIAKYVYATGAAHGKRVQALGGAKNHMIIMPDADMGQAVDAAMGAAYGSAGERCMAVSAVLAVGDDTADRFVEQLAPKVRALKIGQFDEPGVEMGPVITKEAKDRIIGYINQGESDGANVVVDGRNLSLQGYENGFFVGGTLLDHVTPDMSVYRDEIFGPVLSVVRVDTYAEGVKMISDNGFGNGAAIFTRDGGAARQFQQDADAGMVGINVPIPVPVGYHSFGGWKDSLFGDTTMYGPEGLRFYTRPKVVTSRWPDPSTSSVNLGFPQND